MAPAKYFSIQRRKLISWIETKCCIDVLYFEKDLKNDLAGFFYVFFMFFNVNFERKRERKNNYFIYKHIVWGDIYCFSWGPGDTI